MFGLTPLTLRFSLFGIPIRLSVMFLLFEAGLAFLVARNDVGQLRGWKFLLAFVVISFVSILMQTMAHVLMGRWYGMPGAVQFSAMGAQPVGDYPRLTGWQRFWVAAAGPITGFGLVMLAQTIKGVVTPQLGRWFPGDFKTQKLVDFMVAELYLINLYYTIYKSLPIQPLPGGDMVREILLWLMPKRGLALSYFLSMIFALALVALTLYQWRQLNVPIYYFILPLWAFGSLAFENGKHWFTTMRENSKRRIEEQGPPIVRDEQPHADLRDDPNTDPYARRL
ncbi:MAG: hypothetical protein K2X38_19045 [Gemmataceae bacterium]|nr:hypothetical protein [Gemmataceae bacterium]